MHSIYWATLLLREYIFEILSEWKREEGQNEKVMNEWLCVCNKEAEGGRENTEMWEGKSNTVVGAAVFVNELGVVLIKVHWRRTATGPPR